MLEFSGRRHRTGAQTLCNGSHDVEAIVAHRDCRSHLDMKLSGANAGKSRDSVHREK
jgi:hypothetical protein